MNVAKLRQPLKTHGGKAYLAERIVDLIPQHLHYCEPFFGGGAVLFAKDPHGVSEVVNDLDGDLINFWKVMQDEDAFSAFRRKVEATPFAEAEWRKAYREAVDPGPRCPIGSLNTEGRINAAFSFFVLCRQSLAGRRTSFTGITRTRTRSGMNNEVSAWISCVDGLPQVHERLRRVLILGPRPAVQVIRSQDGVDTATYCDPPYMHSTRSTTTEYGEREMTDDQHAELLDTLNTCRGAVLLSGYSCDLYERELTPERGWERHAFSVANAAAGGKKKKVMTEVIWKKEARK